MQKKFMKKINLDITCQYIYDMIFLNLRNLGKNENFKLK